MAYIIVAVTLIELGGAIFEALLLPDWSPRLLTVLLMLGFPLVLLLAWVFDVTPSGVRRAAGSSPEPPPRTAAAPAPTRLGRGRASVSHASPTLPRSSPVGSAHLEPEPAVPPDPERVKRAAFSHVRHELRTPVTAIIGYAEMLLEDGPAEADEEIIQDLRNVREAGLKLLALVDGILHPDRMGMAGADLESVGARIRADLRNPINAVVGYSEMLIEASREQGLEHLLPDLGRILTAARRLLELSTDIVQVATGAPESGYSSTLREASVLTQKVLSRIGPAGSVSLEASGAGQASLLIVDDNAVNRDLLSRQLARQGYLVATAENGRHALDLLDRRDFDLILLDIIMPELDGVETLRRIKSDPRLADIPVLMLSSLEEAQSAIRCIELGAEDYLAKPFHAPLLQARIGANLEIRRLRRRERQHEEALETANTLAVRLLRGAVPESLAERIQNGEADLVESYPQATVLWCAPNDAEASALARDPRAAGEALARLLERVSAEAEPRGLETISQGLALVVAAGLGASREDDAARVAECALALADRAGADGESSLRLGMHTGEITAVVAGRDRLAVAVLGEAVDLARRLANSAPAGGAHVSPAAHALLHARYRLGTRGVVEIPEWGQMRTFVLSGRTTEAARA